MVPFVNNLKTTMLLATMVALFGLVGFLLTGSVNGLMFALILGGVFNVGAYWFSDKIAISAMKGQEVDARSAPDLHEMVSRLANNANLPMPKVYICPQEAPNAFATGRNPKNAAVAVTNGALRLLDYDELEGVIAHELAHIKNRDTLTSTIAGTFAGVFSWLPYMLFFGGGNRDVHPVVLLVTVLLAPLAAAIIQMAISRSREYVADADGATIAGTPHGLIAALQKLDNANRRIPMAGESPAQNHMFIVQPLSGGGMSKLFSTHPRMQDRIAKLREHPAA